MSSAGYDPVLLENGPEIAMVWTELTRAQHRRKTKRYPSDLTNAEGKIVRSFLLGRNHLERPRKLKLRRVWDALRYFKASGCTCSLLLRDFSPVSAVQYYFYRWFDHGLLAEINRHLVAAARLAAGRDVQPTARVIDSQSGKYLKTRHFPAVVRGDRGPVGPA